MKLLSTKLHIWFRDNVEARLAELGWNQEILADKMKCTPSYISQILGGHRGVGLDSVEKFAKVLRVEPADLLRNLQKSG